MIQALGDTTMPMIRMVLLQSNLDVLRSISCRGFPSLFFMTLSINGFLRPQLNQDSVVSHLYYYLIQNI